MTPQYDVNSIPLAAVSLPQKQLTQIANLYPNFPLDSQYNLIIMDCPWTYTGERCKPPYRCLEQKELKVLPIKQISTESSILLIWSTNPLREKALELLRYYGFTYRQTLFVWVKQRNGITVKVPGVYTDTNTEELLIATRGQIKNFIRPGKRLNQLVYAEVGKHSEKPKKIMDMVSKVFNLEKMTSLEVFARRRTNPSMDLYGDDLEPKFQQAKKQTISKISCELPQIEQATRVGTLMQLFEQKVPARFTTSSTSFHKLFSNNLGVFAFSKKEFGLTDVLQHHIVLKPDAIPIARKPYKMADVETTFIDLEVNMLLSLGCIEEASSEWSSTVVLARKHNGEYRMCIDYRGLNQMTVRDQYPLPRIDQVLTTVCKGKVFSKLDLKSGFWQVGVYQRDRPKTCFVCKQGTFQWKRMPFGLTNAPATFQRLMEIVLKPYLNKFCLVYIDDVIVYSDDIESHMQHLQQVMDALSEANLKLGHDKCIFAQDRIEILGHEVCNGSYNPLGSRVDAILKLEPPTDVKGIQIFLGLVNYHGQFIKDLAKIAKPMRQLTKKGIPFQWGQPQQQAFEKLKQIVATKPILHIPVYGKLMILYTDFSENGVGAVLSQQVDEKTERVIEYASRTLKKHENNYPAYKGEVLAVRWALEKFRQYLLQAPFRLVLDNHSAVDLLKQRKSPQHLNSLQKTVLNWVLDMQEYEFEPVHRAGSSHNNADALSRLKRGPSTPIIQNFYWWGHDPDSTCIVCKKPDVKPKNDILICDYCSRNFHQKCHIPNVNTIPSGSWYCDECIQLAESLEHPDVTLDFRLIESLQGFGIPKQLPDQRQAQIAERQKVYYYDRDRLRLREDHRVIPTLTERQIIMAQIHDLKGHCTSENLYQTINAEYFWENMRQDVAKFTAQCAHCTQMNPKYIPNPYLHPTEKGDRPMSILHIDLSGDLQKYTTSRGNRYLMIIIDAFSKWIELYPIPNKQASTTQACMWDFIKTYGSPTIVRTDKGTEFGAEFRQLLSDLRIEFVRIATSNPQANGQVERVNRTAKNILRRFVQSPTQKVEWDEAATAAQMSLNSNASQSTKTTPYEVLFGRRMAYPSSVLVDFPPYIGLEPDQNTIKTYVHALQQKLNILHLQVRRNIQIADERNKRLYDQRHEKDAKRQPTFHNGDFVLVRIPKVTKLGKKGKGPFIFVKYVSRDKLTSELLDPSQLDRVEVEGVVTYRPRTFTYSTRNLAKIILDPEQFDLTKNDSD